MTLVTFAHFAFVTLFVAGCSSTATGTDTDAGTPSGSSGDSSGSSGSSGGASSGGTSSGASTSDAGPAPAPAKLSVTIDGKTVTAPNADLWANVTAPGEYDLFIKIVGLGYPVGSDIAIHATRIGPGCGVGTNNSLYLRPDVGTQFSAPSTPGCGLSIDQLPRLVGGRFVGTFGGTVESLDTPKTTRTMMVSFDVPRTE